MRAGPIVTIVALLGWWTPATVCAQNLDGAGLSLAPATAGDAPEVSPAAPADQGASQPAPASAPERPVATRQSSFAIPFSIDQALASGSQPVEVQLLVSSDRGKQWKLYLCQRPDARKFNYRAAGDGEYWFASRTIDAQGRSIPEGELQPELKVVIDTQAPKFELSATVGQNGDIKTVWNVFDPNLMPETFKLEYRAAAESAWLPITLGPLPPAATRATLTGEQVWTAKTTSLVVDIRGEVRDDAGNPAVVTRRVFLPRVARRQADKPSEGLLSELASLAKSPFKTAETTTAPPDPFAARRPAPIDASPVTGDPPAGPRGPVGRPLTVPPTGIPPASVAGAAAKKPGEVTQPWAPAITKKDELPVDVERYPPARSPTLPPVASRFVTNTTGGNSTEGSTPPVEVPPGERPTFTSARHFNLDYDADSVGPSGVSVVELWGTSDGGRAWTKWGTDADKQSPVRVDVEGDGMYGFRVVVESGIGLAGPRPHSGDMADIWVGVDSVKPRAQLTSATFGAADYVGQLDIRWEASDENLQERPVTLSFAEQAEGPWIPIAAGLPNTGRYQWSADPRLPRLIHLRLEVKDEAGNVGVYQLGEPISTEGLSPKGRIRGIRPLDDHSQGAARERVIR